MLKNLKRLLLNFLRPSFPQMSAEETEKVIHFIRTTFPQKQWIKKTRILAQYMSEVESQMVYFWIENGPDATFQIVCARDNEEHGREGFKMGEFLEGFYQARGYRVYGMTGNVSGPLYKWTWELSFAGLGHPAN